jgi:type I restriction enzyme, R subunit
VHRQNISSGAHDVDLFYGTPSPGNAKAAERFALNRFSVTRQLRYSRDDTAHALDLALFINGLPIATFELKNSLTKQTVEDAVEQYKRDRDPREKLFEFGRCIVHLAVDDAQVKFCTHLKGKPLSWADSHPALSYRAPRLRPSTVGHVPREKKRRPSRDQQ